MKNFVFLCLLFTWQFSLEAQQIKISKGDLEIKEPYKIGDTIVSTDTIQLKLRSEKEKDTIKLIIGKESTIKHYVILKEKANKSFRNDSLFFTKNEAIIRIAISTNVFSDKDEFLILKFNDYKGEQILQDTLTVTNTYPFTSSKPEQYAPWDDPKRAELFIGTNFDFINSKLNTTDWYGGVRVFLPNITTLRKSSEKLKPKWGIAGGIYQNKSMSNYNNGQPESRKQTFYRVTSIVSDSNNKPLYNLRYDTLMVTTQLEINNFGMYFTPLYMISHYQFSNSFVTNIFLGLHTEVIRRNYAYTYTFDTLGYKTVQVSDSVFRYYYPKNFTFAPKNNKLIFYDSYFGAIITIQFLWKDILELKLSPCIGLGPGGPDKSFFPFYLVQFDLLAKLGGISLNLGGEVRGYFPNEAPIITAYLGASFTIAKLKDFLTK